MVNNKKTILAVDCIFWSIE